jgi:hypothetical protein
VRPANLAIKFALELAAIAAFAYWGAVIATGAVAVVLAVAAPLAMVVVWGAFCGPRAKRRLRPPARIPLELAIFALAVAALAGAGQLVLSAVLAVVVLLNAALLTRFDQWEQ